MPATPASHSAAPAAPVPGSPRFRRGGRWLLGLAALLVAGALAVALLLDPWLRRSLEKQVAQQTHGQYQLQIGALRTSLWHRSIWLRHLRLRPAAQVADTLPRLRLDLAQVRVTGVGLWALLRRELVPVDSVGLDSVRLEVLALARRPTKSAAKPLHERLPLHLVGLRIGYVGVLRLRAGYEPADSAAGKPSGRLGQAGVVGHDLFISAQGAADTQRLAYAAAWELALRQAQGRVAGHRMQLGRLRFATATQRVELDSLRIREPAPGQGKPGAVHVNLTLPHAALTGLRAAAWQHQHHLRADSLLVDAPALAFTPPAQPPPDLWKLLAPLARRADLRCLRVRDGHLRVEGLAHAPSLQLLNATGRGIRIDSVARQQPWRIAYATAWTARLDGLAAAFSAPDYTATGAHLRVNTAAHSLLFSGLRLTPRFSPVQLNRRYGYQVPQLSVVIPELAVAGLDYARLVAHGDVRAARATVRRPVVRINSDGRGPINPHRSVITPEDLRKVDTRIDVRRLDLVDGNLYTRYRSPLTPLVGTMAINHFAGTLRNVSNDPRRQTIATPLTGTATAYLQNRCRLTVHVAVPLLDPRGRHRVWGTFGAAPFAILNAMTVPTKLVEFRKGDVQRVDFDLRADQQRVTGTMTARYTGLQLELLSYKKGETRQSLGKKIVSKLANAVVIRDQNPRRGGRVVTGDMTSRREPRFSVFALWRQGVVSGLFNSVGLPQAMARKISQSQDVAPLPAAGSR